MRQRIECEVTYGEEAGLEYVEVTCSRCGHSEMSWGTGEPSIYRCLALLRENCPQGEVNFYVSENE